MIDEFVLSAVLQHAAIQFQREHAQICEGCSVRVEYCDAHKTIRASCTKCDHESEFELEFLYSNGEAN